MTVECSRCGDDAVIVSTLLSVPLCPACLRDEDGTEPIEHENWEDVTDRTRFTYHWHHTDPPTDGVLSIRMANERVEPLAGTMAGWTVELYPEPETGDMRRWSFTEESYGDPQLAARSKVLELMDRYD